MDLIVIFIIRVSRFYFDSLLTSAQRKIRSMFSPHLQRLFLLQITLFGSILLAVNAVSNEDIQEIEANDRKLLDKQIVAQLLKQVLPKENEHLAVGNSLHAWLFRNDKWNATEEQRIMMFRRGAMALLSEAHAKNEHNFFPPLRDFLLEKAEKYTNLMHQRSMKFPPGWWRKSPLAREGIAERCVRHLTGAVEVFGMLEAKFGTARLLHLNDIQFSYAGRDRTYGKLISYARLFVFIIHFALLHFFK